VVHSEQKEDLTLCAGPVTVHLTHPVAC
jgi:hypothetical protein